ncbi:hypothetical protein D6779_10980 [Candidatus Parcubacteria bacterium]|nr:MAG: hypothetical protein D6779_10980 [Candidatus Parcubacteria bacterium]
MRSRVRIPPGPLDEVSMPRGSRYPEEIQQKARELRRQGLTYQQICNELNLNIPKSTLSNWLSDIELTEEQRAYIQEHIAESAAQGRRGGRWGGAAGWNREMKRRRIQQARDKMAPLARQLVQDEAALMLMASALYMGEGAKSEKQFAFGNSDPQLIKAWLAILRRVFDIDESKLRCQLAITEGMDEAALKEYWSEVTGIPVSRFMKSSIRKDSGGRKREGYKGVCIVHYYSLEVKRLLGTLGKSVIESLLEE